MCRPHYIHACLLESCCLLPRTVVVRDCWHVCSVVEVRLQVCVGVKPGALKSNASWYCHECAELKRNGQIK